MNVRGVLETCLYAADLEAAEAFYTTALGLKVLARAEGRHVFFRCGAGVLLVFNPERTASEQTYVRGSPVPMHGARGAGHVAFAIAEGELDGWRERLAELGVAVESEVEWPQGGRSIYLRDPAGNSVELAPPGIWGLEE
ncbi:MAG TPA: VOC family protein [Longimicrobiaceae bacterium]|nr:VOC family protein [Longimicrobiaceae bacterium]